MLRTYGSRVFIVGSDYIYPYESNRIMSDLPAEIATSPNPASIRTVHTSLRYAAHRDAIPVRS